MPPTRSGKASRQAALPAVPTVSSSLPPISQLQPTPRPRRLPRASLTASSRGPERVSAARHGVERGPSSTLSTTQQRQSSPMVTRRLSTTDDDLERVRDAALDTLNHLLATGEVTAGSSDIESSPSMNLDPNGIDAYNQFDIIKQQNISNELFIDVDNLVDGDDDATTAMNARDPRGSLNMTTRLTNLTTFLYLVLASSPQAQRQGGASSPASSNLQKAAQAFLNLVVPIDEQITRGALGTLVDINKQRYLADLALHLTEPGRFPRPDASKLFGRSLATFLDMSNLRSDGFDPLSNRQLNNTFSKMQAMAASQVAQVVRNGKEDDATLQELTHMWPWNKFAQECRAYVATVRDKIELTETRERRQPTSAATAAAAPALMLNEDVMEVVSAEVQLDAEETLAPRMTRASSRRLNTPVVEVTTKVTRETSDGAAPAAHKDVFTRNSEEDLRELAGSAALVSHEDDDETPEVLGQQAIGVQESESLQFETAPTDIDEAERIRIAAAVVAESDSDDDEESQHKVDEQEPDEESAAEAARAAVIREVMDENDSESSDDVEAPTRITIGAGNQLERAAGPSRLLGKSLFDRQSDAEQLEFSGEEGGSTSDEDQTRKGKQKVKLQKAKSTRRTRAKGKGKAVLIEDDSERDIEAGRNEQEGESDNNIGNDGHYRALRQSRIDDSLARVFAQPDWSPEREFGGEGYNPEEHGTLGRRLESEDSSGEGGDSPPRGINAQDVLPFDDADLRPEPRPPSHRRRLVDKGKKRALPDDADDDDEPAFISTDASESDDDGREAALRNRRRKRAQPEDLADRVLQPLPTQSALLPTINRAVGRTSGERALERNRAREAILPEHAKVIELERARRERQREEALVAAAIRRNRRLPEDAWLEAGSSDDEEERLDVALQTLPAHNVYRQQRNATGGRIPWTIAEEKYFREKLSEIGPDWKELINRYGPAGDVSQELRHRTVVSLKDKAVNMKLDCIKSGRPWEWYLEDVTVTRSKLPEHLRDKAELQPRSKRRA
ncbi:TTAGGG repeat binding factor [Microbotryomycetes sp. JL221]|nr:TTAGGG repeat binding factor [Microbotryomycetes sp. JL221]